MPSKCNIEKIKKEIDKCVHPNEMLHIKLQVDTYIKSKLDEECKKQEDAAMELRSKIQNLN